MPKQLINRKEDVVLEALNGVCAATPFLKRIDGFPEIKVVVDASARKSCQVAVISGGGAGHEPAHAGYVGPGMLSAAVLGDIFASPPAEAVLAAIQAITGEPGCLLIIKNYTGDRLNFGLAAEQAKAMGLRVESLIVGDDCALPGTGLAGRRGIAGTVLVHKVAGAAAAEGLSLEQVKAEAEAAACAVGSMGVATRVCTLPGGKPSTRLEDDEIEMGLGIHGEPGACKKKIGPVKEIVAEVLDTIAGYMKLVGSQEEFALLVNNMGGAACLEMGIVADAAFQHVCQACRLRIARSYVGTFMTSLDMPGFSLSLLKLNERRKQLLDAPTKAPAWPDKDAHFSSDPSVLPLAHRSEAPIVKRPAELTPFGQQAEACISSAANALIDMAHQLDDWDRSIGDGDCGSTIKRGAETIKAAKQEILPFNDAGPLSRCLADCARSMGGTSGALYNIFFMAAAGSLPREGAADVAAVAEAFSAGARAIEHYGGASVGSRTMLDALLPAADALAKAANAGAVAEEAAEAAAEAASKGAESTKVMAAAAGRSSYIPDAQVKGIPDPGAKAVAVWLEAVKKALSRNAK